MPTPAKYNEKQHNSGRLTDAMIATILIAASHDDDFAAELAEAAISAPVNRMWDLISDAILIWQSENGLLDDGLFGARSAMRFTRMNVEPHATRKVHPIALETLIVARSLLGQGEEFQDNAGEFIHRLRNFPYGEDYDRSVGNWCAFFVNYCMRLACTRLGRSQPMSLEWYDKRFGKDMPFGSAKWHVEQLAKVGREVKSIEEVLPGDWVAWQRGRKRSRYGHIEIVETAWNGRSFGTIGGNVGTIKDPFIPAVVRRRKHTSDRRIHLIGRLV